MILPAITLDQQKAEQTPGIEEQETPVTTEISKLTEQMVTTQQTPIVGSSADEDQSPATEAVPDPAEQVTTESAS
ncbi:hypothetical protein ACJBXM_11365, partial [Streptococcus suis]